MSNNFLETKSKSILEHFTPDDRPATIPFGEKKKNWHMYETLSLERRSASCRAQQGETHAQAPWGLSMGSLTLVFLKTLFLLIF